MTELNLPCYCAEIEGGDCRNCAAKDPEVRRSRRSQTQMSEGIGFSKRAMEANKRVVECDEKIIDYLIEHGEDHDQQQFMLEANYAQAYLEQTIIVQEDFELDQRIKHELIDRAEREGRTAISNQEYEDYRKERYGD